MNDPLNEPTMEQRILRVMRKVLANVVKDATPRDGMPGCLSARTVDDIRYCFELISVRENELAEHLKQAQPMYPDQRTNVHRIVFNKPAKPDAE